MNSEKETSVTTPTEKPSSPSSPTAELETDPNTDPLVGLCPTPLHLMTEEEKRIRVVYLQQMRQSFQTFKSEMERDSKAPKKVNPKPSLDDMEELL